MSGTADVLILGAREGPEARRVAAALRARGGSVACCDTARFPAQTRITLEDGVWRLNRRRLPIPRAVYVRGLAYHPLVPGFEDDLETRPRGFIAQCDEKRALLESLLLELEARGARLVNGLEANAIHSQKPRQLALLDAAGVPVPASIATNDPAAVRRFVRKAGRAIYKPLAGGARVLEVGPDDLAAERLEALRLAPVLFQAYVPGPAVRAYVAGTRIVAAAEIHSPAIDYRGREDAIVPTRLSLPEKDRALRAAAACGMAFAGIDLIRSPEGPVLLDCNPSPMFASFERQTGLDVAGPLAAWLLSRTAW